jgi:hypothetical protein
LKLDTLVMIQTKFGFDWSSTFRGEDFWKSLRRTTNDDDGRQVMGIAHMTLWVRWANKKSTSYNRNKLISKQFSKFITRNIEKIKIFILVNKYLFKIINTFINLSQLFPRFD